MAPVKTQATCPNCRQPNVVEIEQLFDVRTDPEAKQRLLSGQANLLRCAACGYVGQIPQPVIYHDPAKELLLTFVPPELGMTRDAQERLIGPLISKVVNSLPADQRKAYLLQPKSMLTIQTLYETILGADGITKEMIKSQQDRLNLLQRLVNLPDEAVLAAVKEAPELLDREFFTLLSAIAQNALASGNEPLAQRLGQIQELVLPHSEYGSEVMEQTQEVQAAIETLQSIGPELTRARLVEVVLQAPNETRLRAYVSLVREGLDYQFFQMLSEYIDKAPAADQPGLNEKRTRLLAFVQDYDKQIQSRVESLRSAIDQILNTEDPKQTLLANIQIVDELFIQVLDMEMNQARTQNDFVRSGRLRLLKEAIEEANKPPAEVEFIEALLQLDTDEERLKLLEASADMVTPEFLEMLNALLTQMGQSEDAEAAEHISALYRLVLRFSMQKNMQGG